MVLMRDGEEEENPGLQLGEYLLGEELGRGAMGAVYRARHRKLGREVALKVVLAGQFASASERRRFLVEAEAAARLDHPNLVTVHELGEADGRLYYAMRLVEGQTLAERLRLAPLPVREAAQLVVKIARAVEHAHRRGVLHRDLKPGNVLLDCAGEPHVADFGLARRLDRDGSLTMTGSPMGTPTYMAPEIIAGRDATVAVDTWSLGAMLYEMVSGGPPFTGATVSEMLLSARECEPERLRGRIDGVDRDLESIILHCLEKEPACRFPSALALAEDLERWLRREPVQARPATPMRKLAKWTRRHPAIAALSGLAVLLFLGGTAGIVWQWKRAVDSAARAEWARHKAEASELETKRALYAADMNLCQAALRGNNVGRARRLLDSHRPSTGRPDLRGWEWRHLWMLCRNRATASLPPAPHEIRGVAISADAEKVWTYGYDGTLQTWKMDGAELGLAQTFNARTVGTIALSSDGTRLFAPLNHKQSELRSIDGKTAARVDIGSLTDAAFHPDGSLVAAQDFSGMTRIWRTGDATQVAELPGPKMTYGHGGSLAFIPGEKPRFATAGMFGKVTVHEMETFKPVLEFKAHSHGCVSALAASPDGRLLATGSCFEDPAVHVWDSATGARIATLSGHSSWISTVLFSADGQRLYTASADQTIRGWSTSSWREVAVLRGHTDEIWSMAVNGRWLVSGSKNGETLLWDTGRSSGGVERHDFPGEVRQVQDVPGSSQAVIATNNAADGSFTRWTPNCSGVWSEERMPLVRAPGRYLADSGNGYFAGWRDGLARIESFATKPPSVVGEIGTEKFDDLRARKEGDWFALVRKAGTLTLFETATRTARELTLPVTKFRGVVFDQAQPRLAVLGQDSSWHLYDIPEAKWQPPLKLDALDGNIRFSRDLRWLAQTNGKRTTLRRIEPRPEIVLSLEQENPTGSVAFSPDSRWFATGNESGVARLWRLKDEGGIDPPRVLRGHLNSIHSLVFSHDSQRVVTLCSNAEAAKFWDVETGLEILTLTGKGTMLYKPVFLAEGNVLAAGGQFADSPWHAWHAPSFEAIAQAEKGGRWKVEPPRPRAQSVGSHLQNLLRIFK
jgi:WD40 repeat protein/tRNA A-37 threonylcarbamoyl transferase component Bud32